MAPAHDVFGLVGTTIAGAFQVEDVVAEGGFAVVYRAYHSGFRAPVALKCLKIPQYFSPEEQRHFQEQFQAEAELLFKLSASIPHIVRPLHVEAVIAPDGSFMPFLALEWLEGQTIDQFVKQLHAHGAAPSLSDLVLMLTPVARALEKAHKFAGPDGRISIVHRDMKPENVFIASVGGEGIVKVLDFGIAKALSMATEVAGRAPHGDAKNESFSPAYGAPEQWLPRRFGHTGPWTDVWGLALTLVELAAMRPIIEGDHAVKVAAVVDPLRRPTPRSNGLAVSNDVEAVFARALAVDPRERYAEAGEFWDELLQALGLDPREGRPSQSGSYQAVWVSVARSALSSSSGSYSKADVLPDLTSDLEVGPSPSSRVSGGGIRELTEEVAEYSVIELDLGPEEQPRSGPISHSARSQRCHERSVSHIRARRFRIACGSASTSFGSSVTGSPLCATARHDRRRDRHHGDGHGVRCFRRRGPPLGPTASRVDRGTARSCWRRPARSSTTSAG